MFFRFTVLGSIALLKVMLTVRPLIAVLTTSGLVVSWSVKEIFPVPTRTLPSLATTAVPLVGSWIE